MTGALYQTGGISIEELEEIHRQLTEEEENQVWLQIAEERLALGQEITPLEETPLAGDS